MTTAGFTVKRKGLEPQPQANRVHQCRDGQIAGGHHLCGHGWRGQELHVGERLAQAVAVLRVCFGASGRLRNSGQMARQSSRKCQRMTRPNVAASIVTQVIGETRLPSLLQLRKCPSDVPHAVAKASRAARSGSVFRYAKSSSMRHMLHHWVTLLQPVFSCRGDFSPLSFALVREKKNVRLHRGVLTSYAPRGVLVSDQHTGAPR